jgi:hypothetical protein
MKIPTILSTGNLIDHLLDSVRIQIVREAVGKGLDRNLDETVKEISPMLRSIDRINVRWMYRSLSHHFPFLKRLENPDELKKLAAMAENRDRGTLRAALENMMVRDRNLLWASRPLKLDEDQPDEQ